MATLNEFELTILYIVVSALLSGLLGVLISNWDHKRNEIKRMKLRVLQQLMGNRYAVNGKAFLEALNQVAVVFHDSKEVITALKSVHEDVMSAQRSRDLSNQKLLELFKAMFKHLDIKTEPLTDNFFLTAFIPTESQGS
jgi:hypothetical protein